VLQGWLPDDKLGDHGRDQAAIGLTIETNAQGPRAP
jgi:hypothetical protein